MAARCKIVDSAFTPHDNECLRSNLCADSHPPFQHIDRDRQIIDKGVIVPPNRALTPPAQPPSNHIIPVCLSQSNLAMSSGKPAANIASEVSVLKTKAAAKKGLGTVPSDTETIWPKPEWVSPSERAGEDGSLMLGG